MRAVVGLMICDKENVVDLKWEEKKRECEQIAVTFAGVTYCSWKRIELIRNVLCTMIRLNVLAKQVSNSDCAGTGLSLKKCAVYHVIDCYLKCC